MMSESVNLNNNIASKKKELRTVIVKIPHLSKKLNVKYKESDLVYNLIKNIQCILKNTEYNFGIFVKNHKRNVRKFANYKVPVIEIVNGDNKLFYKKRDRVFQFDIPKFKKLKTINNKENQEMFIKLILNNDLQGIMNLLCDGFDPNYLFNDEPPLHYSVIPENSVALLTLLISQGAHLDYRSAKNQTVLHKAVRMSNPEAVKVILEFGFDPNVEDCYGLSPMYFTVLYNNDTACFERLLKYRADVNCENGYGLSMLHQACYNNKLEHLKLLLRNCDDINTQSQNCGNTLLHFSVLGKAMDCISYLLDNGAQKDIRNYENMTPLEIAEAEFPEAIQLFITEESTVTAHEIEEDICCILHEEIDFKVNEKIMNEIIHLCVSEFFNNLNNGATVIDESENLQRNSIVSTSSLVAGSIFSVSEETECRNYFGMQTKLVEFKRIIDAGFGFSLETELINDEEAKVFAPSCSKPSIHRICKWNVLSTMMTLYVKPYLLEVNGIYVGNMPYSNLFNLISSIREKAVLKIVNHGNSRQASDNEFADITSRISSIGQLNEIASFDQNIFEPTINHLTTAKELHSFPGAENISTLTEKSTEGEQLYNLQSAGIDYYVPENDDKAYQTFTKSTVSEPIAILPKSRQIMKDEPFVPSSLDRGIMSPNLFSKDRLNNANLASNTRSFSSKELYAQPNVTNKLEGKRILSEIYNNSSTQFTLPQYGLHRTGIVLNLNKSKMSQNQIHIPLQIN